MNAMAGRCQSGIPGLDEILSGGLICERMYLLDGNPGAGKTTLAMQFLIEGARTGEGCLYVTLSETALELRAVAAAHGWSLDGIEIVELIVDEVESGLTGKKSTNVAMSQIMGGAVNPEEVAHFMRSI